MGLLVPFLAIWAVAAIILAAIGQGWSSLFAGLAPLGLVALWVENPIRDRVAALSSGACGLHLHLRFAVLICAGFVAGLAGFLTIGPGAGVWFALAAVGGLWLSALAVTLAAELRSLREDRWLEQVTRDRRLFTLPESGADAENVRTRLALLLRTDPSAAVMLIRTVPDGLLLPPPQADMDIGLEDLAMALGDSDLALALRILRLAERACLLEFSAATTGAAGSATATRLRRIRREIYRRSLVAEAERQ